MTATRSAAEFRKQWPSLIDEGGDIANYMIVIMEERIEEVLSALEAREKEAEALRRIQDPLVELKLEILRSKVAALFEEYNKGTDITEIMKTLRAELPPEEASRE